jgi:signal transduction histidine kinase
MVIPKKKFALITIAYWLVLAYAIAALLFWFLALNNQSNQMTSLRLEGLNKASNNYQEQVSQLTSTQKRKKAQYLGEGITFLAIILLGAIFVYKAIRKQLKLTAQQQNFIMAVTHELKTPIAVTQLNLETLKKRKLDPDKQEKIINNTLQEASRLNSLCNNILFSSQFEANAYKNNMEELEFDFVVNQLVEQHKKRNPTATYTTNLEEINLMGDKVLLEILINNLLDNAIKYSPTPAHISLSLKHINSKITFSISDNGIGISAVEKPKVFDKFYRVGAENTRTTKGTGLGLYLCKKIADIHKANILVTNNHPQGTTFTLEFIQNT